MGTPNKYKYKKISKTNICPGCRIHKNYCECDKMKQKAYNEFKSDKEFAETTQLPDLSMAENEKDIEQEIKEDIDKNIYTEQFPAAAEVGNGIAGVSEELEVDLQELRKKATEEFEVVPKKTIEFVCKEPKCKKIFGENRALQLHVRRVHKGFTPWPTVPLGKKETMIKQIMEKKAFGKTYDDITKEFNEQGYKISVKTVSRWGLKAGIRSRVFKKEVVPKKDVMPEPVETIIVQEPIVKDEPSLREFISLMVYFKKLKEQYLMKDLIELLERA